MPVLAGQVQVVVLLLLQDLLHLQDLSLPSSTLCVDLRTWHRGVPFPNGTDVRKAGRIVTWVLRKTLVVIAQRSFRSSDPPD